MFCRQTSSTQLWGASATTPLAAPPAAAWISEIEPLQMQMIVQMYFTPEEKKKPKLIESAKKGLERPLSVLDAHLADRDYLLGDAFTIADLNLASVIDLLGGMGQHDYSAHSNVKRWTDACYARPSYAAAKARD